MLLELYILVWPLISAIVLYIIVKAFMKDYFASKKEGRDMV